MRVLRFQIRLPTGQIDSINIEGERVLIGSGAHCEIRLPLDQAAVEHVLIELGPAGVFARALNFQPSPMINNVPFMQSPLPPEAVLGVNQTQIAVAVADSAGLGGQAQQKKKGQSPVALIGLALILKMAGVTNLAAGLMISLQVWFFIVLPARLYSFVYSPEKPGLLAMDLIHLLLGTLAAGAIISVWP